MSGAGGAGAGAAGGGSEPPEGGVAPATDDPFSLPDAGGAPGAPAGKAPADDPAEAPAGAPAAVPAAVPAAAPVAAPVAGVAEAPVAGTGGDPAFGEPGAVDLLAAALRADASDLETYERVLVATIADALPSGMVEIDRERSLGDRLAGREGRVVALRVHLGDSTLELRSGRGGLTGVLARGVRGVTISRKEVPVAEWTRLLAEHLHATAVESAEAREALGRLLGAG